MDMIVSEQWRPVVGFEGVYEVSIIGRVRSLDRKVIGRRYKGRVLKQAIDPTGRARVVVQHAGDIRQALVSHLVAEAFIGPRPKGRVVAHNNGDPADNRLANLRYTTSSDNSTDMVKHGRSPARLTPDDVREVRRLRAHGLTLKAIADRYDVRPVAIGRICTGKTWKHLRVDETDGQRAQDRGSQT